jgi:hypothetical protein
MSAFKKNDGMSYQFFLGGIIVAFVVEQALWVISF